jgi:dihydroflavonol-4-reductase
VKTFVTGSTGFLGSNLVRALVQQGHEVKALARSAEKARKVLGDLDIQLINGDMHDVERFAHGLADCDVLFHTAAYTHEYYRPGKHDDLLHDINVAGTMRLCEAAVRQHVSKVIYVSSATVLDIKASKGSGDETAPYKYNTTDLFVRSKIAAEEALHKLMENNNIRIIYVLPGVMIGPGDSGPSNVGRFVIDFLNRRVPAILPGGFPFVDARDVALAMIRCVDTGRRGERFLVGGRYYDVETVFKTLETVSGVSSPRLHVPYPLAFVFAWVSELIGGMTGHNPQLSREGLRLLQVRDIGSSEKAIRELSVSFRPLEDSLRDQVAWYQANNYSS